MNDTIWVDCAGKEPVAAMRIGGMSVLERVLREQAQQGAARAVVRGDASRLPSLAPLAIAVEVVAPSAAQPSGSRAAAADRIAGVDIADEASRQRAERALLQSCRRPYDGIGDRYVIRAFSLRLTGVLARLGATPNQVTSANIVVGIAACLLAFSGTRTALIAAGALMWCQVILDSCDGELARIRFLGSKFGMWLDNVSDDVIDNLFVVAVGVGLGGPWAIVGVVAGVLRGTCALMIYRDVARAGHPGDVMAFRWWFDRDDDTLAERFEQRISPLAVVRMLGRRDLYVLVWGASCVAGVPLVALGLGVAISVGYFALAVIHTVVRGRG